MVAIQTPLQTTLVHEAGPFSHEEAYQVYRLTIHTNAPASRARRVVIDLKRADEVTTAAFARLVLLRRELLRSGRDLRLIGLHDQAAGLYEVNRLHDVLPRQ